MAAQILAIGTTAASSADVTVQAGAPLTVSLKRTGGGVPPSGAVVFIELKDDASNYNRVDRLSARQPAMTLYGPGTYRFTRVAGTSCGVFSG